MEVVNWIFVFGAWVGVAQFGNSPNCVYDGSVFYMFKKTCNLDRAVLGFMVMLWLTWSVSLAIMVKLKVTERKDSAQAKEIEMRIKNVVEETSRQRNSAVANADLEMAARQEKM